MKLADMISIAESAFACGVASGVYGNPSHGGRFHGSLHRPPACYVSLMIYLNTIHSDVPSEMISQGYAVQWLL